ncbi:MAG: B12-binding domain-containing radical SAM protein [Candidatus Omnitrophica bacterium]|jgi:biotin synthase-like enzyme|nr:B12-binding domain-containing radical SAM protein [Candidatus Omnitrophota bacterium]
MRLTVVFMGAESLSLEAISAFVKRHGHTVNLVFDPALFDDVNYFKIPWLHRILDDRKALVKKIIDSKPDVLGFSVFTDNFRWAVSVAQDVKKIKNIPVIFGGVFPTAKPDYIISLPCVDMVCTGEGEEAMLELLNSMEKKNIDYGIKNIWFKTKKGIIRNSVRALVDLEKLPFLDKKLFEDEVNISRMYMTMTAKGCPYACSYCSQNFMSKFNNTRDKRRRSVDNVMQELIIMKKRYNYREVGFYDSVLTVDKKWTQELMHRYKKEINVPFRAISHPLCIDEDTARSLKEAGCHRVQFGVQTFNEDTKKNYLFRNEKNSKIIQTFEICDKVGLKYSCDHMFGLPGEKEEDQILAARSYAGFRNRVRITCFWTTYFPNTDLVDIAKSLDMLTSSDIEAINKGESPCYIAGSHGYLKNRNLLKVFKNYEILFRAMPLLPKPLVEFILKYNLQKYFKYLPKGLTLFVVDFIVMFAKRDLSGFQYVSYYFWHIKKKLGLKRKRI